MTTIASCRFCGSERLSPVLDFGRMPLADAFPPVDAPCEAEPRYPLSLHLCRNCGLTQIGETVDPGLLFGADYPYFSSFSETVLANARENVEDLCRRKALSSNSRVVEIASNDGYLLRNFVARGIPVLGIDPAAGPAAAARACGVPTLQAFFDVATAERVRREFGAADLVLGNNVLAHVPDSHDFAAALSILLHDEGVAALEFPYLRDMVEKCEFDTIYHEHVYYLSCMPLVRLFAEHGLHINDVRRLPIHGGSIRIYLEKRYAPSPAIRAMLADEEAARIHDPSYFDAFARQVRAMARTVPAALRRLRAEGMRIAGYGAAAKGAIFINVLGIGPDLLDYVVDRNPRKQDRRMPGQRIPIYGPERLEEDRPDYLLVLAWNHAAEIMRQQAGYAERGGRFIVPIPEFSIV